MSASRTYHRPPRRTSWRKKLALWVLVAALAWMASVFLALSQARGACHWVIDPLTNQWTQACDNDGWQSAGGYVQPAPRPNTRPVSDAPDPSRGGQAPLPSRCIVVMSDGSRGSGTLIAERTVLTCRHVAEQVGNSATARFPSGANVSGSVVAVDSAYDLAAIELSASPGITPIEVDDSDLTTGQTLIAGGFGSDSVFRAQVGPIINWVYYDKNSSLTPCPEMSGTARPGDSGGGVTNESKKLVGVLWGAGGGSVNLTCGQPLRRFLDRLFPNRSGAIIGRATPPAQQPTPTAPPVSSVATEPGSTIALQPDLPTSASDGTESLTARLDAIEGRLKGLEDGKQPKGDYLAPGDLGEYAKVADTNATIANTRRSILSRIADLAQVFDARISGASAWSMGKIVAGALGLSTPIGLAIVLAARLGRRKVAQAMSDRASGGARDEPFQEQPEYAPTNRTRVG